MEEHRLVCAQVFQRRIDDVARAGKARLRLADDAAALARSEPGVEQCEAFAAVVGLAVLVAPRAAILHHGRILGNAVAHAGEMFGDVYRRVAVVPDTEQQHLAIELVDPTGRAVDAVRNGYRMWRGDGRRQRPVRGKGVWIVAAHDARQAPEAVGDDTKGAA